MTVGSRKHGAAYHLQTVAAILITIVMIFPLYWMIATSLKSAAEAQLVIPTMFPHEFHFENYITVLTRANFMKYYWNTIVMTAGILILQIGTGTLAAYGFACGKFKGRDAMFYVVLGALMIPIQVTFIPIFIMCANWGLSDTFLGLILPESVSAYYIFMMRNSFLAVGPSYHLHRDPGDLLQRLERLLLAQDHRQERGAPGADRRSRPAEEHLRRAGRVQLS